MSITEVEVIKSYVLNRQNQLFLKGKQLSRPKNVKPLSSVLNADLQVDGRSVAAEGGRESPTPSIASHKTKGSRLDSKVI